jgi:sec-independent protein translocase protein TatB
MFDIGWQELFIVAAIAIVVVGPRDLPRILKTVMSAIKKAKNMASEFQSGIDDVVREVELDDIRREANKMATMDLEDEVKSALDPTGDLDKDLDMSDVQNQLQESANGINTSSDADKPETPTEDNYAGGTETFGGAGPVDAETNTAALDDVASEPSEKKEST